MRRISIADKTQIKQILRARGVLGIVNGRQTASGGLQLWWHNVKDGVCNCCESRRAEPPGQIECKSLSEAANTLWRNRSCLYLCGKYKADDKPVTQLR